MRQIFADDYWDLMDGDKVSVRYWIRHVTDYKFEGIGKPEDYDHPFVAALRYTYTHEPNPSCKTEFVLLNREGFKDLELIGRAGIFVGDRFRCTNKLVLGFGSEYEVLEFLDKSYSSDVGTTRVKARYLHPNVNNWIENEGVFLFHLRENCKRYEDDETLEEMRIVEWDDSRSPKQIRYSEEETEDRGVYHVEGNVWKVVGEQNG